MIDQYYYEISNVAINYKRLEINVNKASSVSLSSLCRRASLSSLLLTLTILLHVTRFNFMAFYTIFYGILLYN